MAEARDPFKQLCIPANKVRETYYGDTYRAVMTVGGIKQLWDIMHISVPFAPVKEAQLIRRFGISREELPQFYQSFTAAVVRHGNILNEIHKSGDKRITSAVVKYVSTTALPLLDKSGKQIGADIYMVSEPMNSYARVGTISLEGTDLSVVLELGLRLLQTAKSMNAAGFTIGAVDLDSTYFEQDKNTGKEFLKLGYAFYSTNTASEDEQKIEYTKNVSPFVYPELPEGTYTQDLNTDMYMICSLLWSLLDGHYYTDPPAIDLEQKPEYAPDEVWQALVNGIVEGGSALRSLSDTLRAVLKQINREEIPDRHIPFRLPQYMLLPLPEPRALPVEEEDAEEEQQGENGKKKKSVKKIVIGAALLLLAIALLGFTLMQLTGWSPAFLRGSDYSTVDLRMSGEDGVYVLEDAVVDRDRVPITGLAINEDGAIVASEENAVQKGMHDDEPVFYKLGEIVYPAEQVSTYVLLEDVSVQIIKKSFIGNDPLYVLSSEIKDLRTDYSVSFSEGMELIELTNDQVESYGLEEGNIVLVPFKTEDGYGDAVAATVICLQMEGDVESETPDLRYALERNAETPDVDDLYVVSGIWTYTLQLSPKNPDAIENTLTISGNDRGIVYFIVEKEDGSTSKANGVRQKLTAEGVTVVVECTREGRYTLNLESADGSGNKKMAITFSKEDASAFLDELGL